AFGAKILFLQKPFCRHQPQNPFLQSRSLGILIRYPIMKTLKLKYYLYGCLGFLLLNCHSEEGIDCFKKQGKEINRTIELAGFTKIHIGPGIALTVKESDEQMVSVRAGENLINDIRFEVVDGELFISDENGCGFLRNTSV